MESLNAIAAKYGKRVDNWMRLRAVSAFLLQYPDGIKTVEGRQGGTFAIRDVAEEFERWCQKSANSLPCRVYFIRAVNMQVFKVGISTNPRIRLKELQTGSPVKLVLSRDVLCDDVATVEQKIHDCLKAYHSHGEWFSCPIEKALAIFDSCV